MISHESNYAEMLEHHVESLSGAIDELSFDCVQFMSYGHITAEMRANLIRANAACEQVLATLDQRADESNDSHTGL